MITITVADGVAERELLKNLRQRSGESNSRSDGYSGQCESQRR